MTKPTMVSRGSSRLFEVRLSVLILPRHSTMPLIAETRHISTTGFVCMLKEPLSIGQPLRCVLFVSEPMSSEEEPCSMCIEAEAEVARIAVDTSDAWFRIGCHMLSYKLISASRWEPTCSQRHTVSRVR